MKHTSLLARAAAAAATLGVALAGALVVTPGAANAALVETDYGYATWAYGTVAVAQQVGLGSSKTGFSYIGCTRLAGVKEDRAVTAANAPANNPALHIGAVESHSETYKAVGEAGGSLSTNRIAGVTLGPIDGPHIVLKGLETTAKAYADKTGKFHTKETFKLADIVAETGTPLDDLNDATGPLFAALSDVLASQDGQIVIPNVGRIALGRKVSNVGTLVAKSNAIALRVTLFGPNGVEGGAVKDDIHVIIGRSHAEIYRHVTSGIFRGFAFASEASVLDGILNVGQLAEQPMPCPGTRGHVRSEDIAGLNLGNANALQLGAVGSDVFGEQFASGKAVAWTRGRVATVNLGDGALVIEGIIGRANITQTKSGNIYRNINGSKILSLTANGEEMALPSPGDVITIPDLATISFFVVEKKTNRDIKVTAVRIKLLDAAAENTGLITINLGVAKVGIKKF